MNAYDSFTIYVKKTYKENSPLTEGLWLVFTAGYNVGLRTSSKEFLSVNNITSNELITKIVDLIHVSISYAQTDAQHSLESNAKEQAQDDASRVTNLYKAIDLLELSFKPGCKY